jgi:hypothetical protein
MSSRKITLGLMAALAFGLAGAAHAAPLNGVSDNGTDALGWYYAISGGQFPTGTTPNGDNGSGGTFRFLADNSADWGRNPSESGNWQKDDWYSDNAGIALTLKNGSSIVYDNNGLEVGAATPADANYYSYPAGGHGAVTAYSMSNNSDWIYAGYFKIQVATTVTQLVGYFAYNTNPNDALTAGFDPANPNIHFRMNIWSNTDGDLLPTDTNSFDGDVFSSDDTAGTFGWSDTIVDRVGSSSTQDIYRLTYTLANSITLQPGEYWFSHDAAVPEPSTIAVLGLGVGALLLRRRGRRA